MKWFKSIFLTLLILVSNSGIAANYHWCGDELVEMSVSLGPEELSCGMQDMNNCASPVIPSEEGQISSGSCCDHDSKVLNTDDELKTSTPELNPVQQNFILAFAFTLISEGVTDTPTSDYPPLRPDLKRLPLFIFHCTYLI